MIIDAGQNLKKNQKKFYTIPYYTSVRGLARLGQLRLVQHFLSQLFNALTLGLAFKIYLHSLSIREIFNANDEKSNQVS